MPSKKSRLNKDEMDQIIAEARRREKTYLEQALKMYPRITTTITIHLTAATGNCCVSTVTTMSTRGIWMEWHDKASPEGEQEPPSTFKAFAGLDALLKNKK